MSRIRLSRGLDRLMLVPACILPILLVLHLEKIPITAIYSSTTFRLFAAATTVIAAILILETVWAPALIIDGHGIAYHWIIGGWSVRWSDVDDIGVYVTPRGSQFLAMKAREGSPAQSSMRRMVSGGYDRLIPKSWENSIEDLNGTIANYWPTPNSMGAQRALEAAHQRPFGRRNHDQDRDGGKPNTETITGFPLVTLALKLRVITVLSFIFLFAAYLAMHPKDAAGKRGGSRGQAPATTQPVQQRNGLVAPIPDIGLARDSGRSILAPRQSSSRQRNLIALLPGAIYS